MSGFLAGEPETSGFKKLAVAGLVALTLAGCSSRGSGVSGPVQQASVRSVPQIYALGRPLPVLKEHEGIVLAVAMSPDNRKMASGDDHRTLIIWDTATWTVAKKINDIGGSMEWPPLAFSPNGQFLLVGDEVWDTGKGTKIQTLPGISNSYNDNMKFSPDGKILATGGVGLDLWDVKTWKLKHKLTGGTTSYMGMFGRPLQVTSVTFSPDGKMLAAEWENNSGIKIVDPTTGEVKQTLDAHSPMAFSRDSTTFAAQTDVRGGTLKFWDTTTWQEKSKIERRFDPIQFTPENQILEDSSRGYDALINIVSPVNGSVLRTINIRDGINNLGRAAAISADSKVLAYGSQYDVKFADLH